MEEGKVGAEQTVHAIQASRLILSSLGPVVVIVIIISAAVTISGSSTGYDYLPRYLISYVNHLLYF